MFKISWQDATGDVQKWLFLNGGGALLLPRDENATRFTRAEADVVLLALYNSGRWNLGGNTLWPHLTQVH